MHALDQLHLRNVLKEGKPEMNNEKSHSTSIPSAKEFKAKRDKRRAMVKSYKSTHLPMQGGYYEINMREYTVTLSQIRSVVAQLRVKGKEYPSFVKICFDTQVVIKGQSENTIDLQYAKEEEVIGFEWLLLGSRNKSERKRIAKFVIQRGHTITERVMNDVHYLRVEDGDIVDLGYRIATELYQLESNAEISLFVNGFEYRPNLTLADVMRFVRLSACQPGFIVDVERISAALRLIHGKRTDRHYAFAVFRTLLGFIRFSDMIGVNLDHRFSSVIHTGPRTNKLEKDILGRSGINLLSACGYQQFSGKAFFEKWFSGTTDHDFREMAEFCVGILHLLFDHQPGYPLEIELCISGPDLKKLPRWGKLPEPEQAGMRKIVLDIEATGLSPDEDHRIIELAAIEISGNEITENRIHRYFNPEREIDEGATEVHGLTLERLKNETTFDLFAHEFAAFIRDAELIIHNAPFDIGFLNAEFKKVGLPPVENICKIVTDTLYMAKKPYPEKKNNLNALCERFGIDYLHRTQHGALLDAELLAAVYFELHKRELH